MICKECGKEIPEVSKFCPECGAKVEQEMPPVKEWYFVEDNQSKGTYSQEEMIEYYNAGRLNKRSFIWKSGLGDWCMFKDSPLASFVTIEEDDAPEIKQAEEKTSIEWFYISNDNVQNGPYSQEQMIQFFEQGVINKNTYVWCTGMSDWVFLKNSELMTQKEENETFTTHSTVIGPVPKRSIALYVVLTLVTCGFFGLYWIYAAANDVNKIMGETEQTQTSGGMVLLFSILTCGIYELYWLYKAGKRLSSIRFNNGFRVTDDSVIMLILAIFGLSIVSMCILQSSINDVINYGD